MNIQKLVPWNWFKKEQENRGGNVPIRHVASPDGYAGALQRFHHEFDNLFDTLFRSVGLSMTANGHAIAGPGWLRPTLDIGATGNAYTVTVELPGVNPKDVHLEVTGDTLSIRGEKREDHEASNKNYYCVERSYGSFERQLTLPDDADKDGIEASFKNGIMSITIPRAEGVLPESKRIEVKSAA